MPQNREDDIRQRAYAMWEIEGRPDGRHEEHWRQAEVELSGAGQSDRSGDVPARGEVPGGDVFEAMPNEGSRS